MIQLTGLSHIPGFIRELDLAFAQMDREISAEFERWTKKVFASIVEGTPQWTGDLAAAWRYAVNYIDETYTPIPSKLANERAHGKQDLTQTVHVRGDDPAVRDAISRAAGAHPTWRDVVWLSNPAPIAEEVEYKLIPIRPVNLIDGRVAMIQYHVDKFERGDLYP